MKAKVVVFDFDDTLTDNKLLDLRSFQYLSSRLGLYMPTRQEIKELRYKSMLAKDIITWMIEKSAKSVQVELLMKLRNEFLNGKESEGLIRIKPKAYSTLKKLKSQGYTLLVATRQKLVHLVPILERRRLKDFFQGLYTNSSEDKTSIYQKILQDFNLLPSECIVVSNLFQDLLPALDLGIKAVGIEGSYGVDQALVGKVSVMHDLTELYTYIIEQDKKSGSST
jgi:FMN phosphatase YigB (HAD superfamily)